MQVELVAQGSSGGTLEAALQQAAASGFDRLDVAVAYATKQGVRALKRALGGFPPQSRWAVGLDDAITQPEALNYILALPGAQLRLVALAPKRRFHPKLYLLHQSGDVSAAIAAIGSGNMTLRGLTLNGEAAVLLSADSAEDAAALKAQWKTFWTLGHKATQLKIDEYSEEYKKAKKYRAKIIELGVAPPEPKPSASVPESLNGDMATALNGWLEVGTATQGKEVEIPKPMLPYFRLPAGKSSALKKFQMPNGSVTPLRLVDRKKNGMWRIEFTSEAITKIIGRGSFYLPNGARRSDQLLVFKKKTNGIFDVRSVIMGSAESGELLAKSTKVGAAMRTIKGAGGRDYGVF